MDVRYIDSEGDFEDARALIQGLRRVALDCEAAGFHRYDDRLSLVQLTAGPVTLLLDPFTLPLGDLLGPIVEARDIEVVMHGADYDVRLLDRDLGLTLRGLFDTQIAAALLGYSALGLSSLLEDHFGIRLSKKYQRADWAQRPLPGEMLEYAATDTLHLERLAELLRDELREKGRLHWAEEEFQELEKVRFDRPDPEQDPVTRVKHARKLEPRQVDRLREALDWRDAIARERDRAHFRVVGDPVLVSVAQNGVRSVRELADLQGMNGGLARGEGEALIERLERVEKLPDEALTGYPAAPRTGGRGRPTPEEEARMARIKDARNRRAKELGIDRGTLFPNAFLEKVAEEEPDSLETLSELPGIRAWQVEAVGEALLDSLRT